MHHTPPRSLAEAVFAYLADFRNELEWNSKASDVHLLTPGPIGLGSRFEHSEQTPPAGRLALISTEITKYENGTEIQFHHASVEPPWEATWIYRLSPDGALTRIAIEVYMCGFGIWRVLVPLMAPLVRRFRLRPSFARLAEALERAQS